MSAQQSNDPNDDKSKSVPETPEGAAAMLQSAIRQCLAAGMAVRAVNHPLHGLLVSVPALMLAEHGITVRPADAAQS